ncbi:MAG: SpoIVB peptidase [Eubacterium sp.]
MKKFIRTADSVFAMLLVVIYGLVIFGRIALPDNINCYSENQISFDNIYYMSIDKEAQVDFQNIQRVSQTDGQLNLFGVIPVKSTTIAPKKVKQVYVSGESFGIKLYTDGVMIVGTKDVDGKNGKSNPAKEAGLEKGDIIVEINNIKVYSSTEVEEMLNDNNGKDYKIRVKRNGNYKIFTLTPEYSVSEGRYKAGIWVRDSTAGIGTITFYNPENSSVAALGHPITDVDTNEIMPILNGEAVKATVTKLYKSTEGETGSLCCDFSDSVIGTLENNSECGIYGKYSCDVSKMPLYEIAPIQEVEKGQAQIISTVDSSGPKLYTVEITRVSYRDGKNDKNLVIKVTDKELLEKTGGIVQGMSGSPIIQNGKLIGALTHVIVDNPEKGYGIFAEKMLEQSEKTE